jgi:hypothetical protein
MSYHVLTGVFGNQLVIDFEGAETWKGPISAYRLREEYEDETTIADRLDKLLKQPGVDQLKSLIIGAWSGSCEGTDASEIIAKLVEVAPRLPKLRSLFLGELTYEECEISWIKQSDVSPILEAFPKLEELRIRGGEGLSFSRVQHDSLKSLAIETGGLSRSTLRELFLCEFPALEHLELLLGESNYGFDGTAEDLQPVLSGRLYPRLKFLGLMNSEIANDLAAVVVNSPIVDRIETLDLSMGNLDDAGVRSLRSLADGHNLKRLNISHHYASDEVVQELQELLPCEVVADDKQDADDEWRPIVHAE